jgi:hypothetical protein
MFGFGHAFGELACFSPSKGRFTEQTPHALLLAEGDHLPGCFERSALCS